MSTQQSIKQKLEQEATIKKPVDPIAMEITHAMAEQRHEEHVKQTAETAAKYNAHAEYVHDKHEQDIANKSAKENAQIELAHKIAESNREKAIAQKVKPAHDDVQHVRDVSQKH